MVLGMPGAPPHLIGAFLKCSGSTRHTYREIGDKVLPNRHLTDKIGAVAGSCIFSGSTLVPPAPALSHPTTGIGTLFRLILRILCGLASHPGQLVVLLHSGTASTWQALL